MFARRSSGHFWHRAFREARSIGGPRIERCHAATLPSEYRLELGDCGIAERVRAGLARARSEGKRLGRPPIAPALEKRSVRPCRLLGGPVCASLRNSLESILEQCSASAALPTA